MKKIILRVKGGLGNQLFSYAAAKSLSFINNAELVLDDTSGFELDKYERKYLLNHFAISSRIANNSEKLFPFPRIKRLLIKINTKLNLNLNLRYFKQSFVDFDDNFFNIEFKKNLILEGYWQSELYFKNIENIIRREFQFLTTFNQNNIDMSNKIKSLNSICIHVRWFDPPQSNSNNNNITADYYIKAINKMKVLFSDIHFFIFSDYPMETNKILNLSPAEATFVSINDQFNPHADLWLMSQCSHFIIANSTFSWWAAWLSENKNKTVFVPGNTMNGESSWGFKGLIPENWTII